MLPRVARTAPPGATGRRPRVSVVVPALDEAERLPALLADLAAQTLPAAEVIVADGGSSDGTAGLAEAGGARLVRSERRGPADQRNAGAAVAAGDLLLFVDADVRLSPGFLDSLTAEAARRRLDVACPVFRPVTASRAVRAFFGVMNVVFLATAPVAASGAGMCIAIRRDLFEHLGGFDPRFRFEDAELLRRAGRAARYRVVPVPVRVSDRRFRRDGVGVTIGRYAAIGVLIALGMFRAANAVGYAYGAYRPERLGTP